MPAHENQIRIAAVFGNVRVNRRPRRAAPSHPIACNLNAAGGLAHETHETYENKGPNRG